ncbi:hypothetical protein LTR78_009532 [Recurvomyces mirabilis]|uniref:MMS19 nucleotide excision repair protein n=1 Tax=Recurvomyces mirabilis TaxID=574656 RepID=A0AAE0TPC6_9PEZI|nr:hypothetical protein LTR78_009532 [Recurvomyces mirabilis]KAK5150013.1 hypothetical protein LTS14_010485 [Recurvomyces mirabilis]
MSDIQLYLLEADKNAAEAKQIAAHSASKLQDKSLKLIDLVTSLEPYLNNKEDGDQRAKSIGYVADLLSALPPKVLSLQERHLLCDFLLGRLEGDVEGVGATARALIALETLGKWDSETVQKFKLQTERLAVVQLVDLLLAKHRDSTRKLQTEDAEFMPAFISYWEGEKDPRNLMIIFSLLQVPMTEWDMGSHAQDLFDSVFNYFPITFKPPPDDPYGITAQDLKDRLKACIAANSDFAPYAFPQLLDKLDSTSINTKRDVLQAMQACITEYEAKTINLYSVTLWDALKFEILNVQEEDLAEEALRTLSLIGGKLAELPEDGPLNAYLRPIIKECNEHLEDAPTKQSEASGRILHALALSGPVVADRVAKGVLPVLFALYHGSESITKRRGLLEVFTPIVEAFVKLSQLLPGTKITSLQAFAEDALNAMVRALVNAPKSEVSFRLASLTGLTQLLAAPGVLNDKQIDRAVDTVTDVVLHEQVDGHGNIRAQAIKALASIAHSAPQSIRDRTIPAFMVELPDLPEANAVPSTKLEVFAQLARERQVFDTVVLRLKNKLNSARRQQAPPAYTRALLLSLLYAFTLGSPMEDDGVILSSYYGDYAQPLIDDIVRQDRADKDVAEVEIVGRICNAILRPQGVHFQATVYHGDREWMARMVSNATASDVGTAPFLLYYYGAIRPEVVEAQDVMLLLKHQASVALHGGQSQRHTASSLRLVSLLVNKFINPKTMRSTLEDAGTEAESLLQNTSSAQALNVAFAVIKGLVLQGKSGTLTTKYLNIILDHLSSTSDNTAPHLFSTLLAPDDILTKENHCPISGLHKQKVFGQVIPKLTTAVRTADTEKKAGYLVALSGILRWLPYSIISPALTDLITALLQTLDLHDEPVIKASALTVFESILMHDPQTLSTHAASLITRLLTSCTTASTRSAGIRNTTEVRAKSLLCLALLPRQLKAETVVPFRRQVVKRLMGCLDDAKRNVRFEAVRCRTAWLGLDEGVDDE